MLTKNYKQKCLPYRINSYQQIYVASCGEVFPNIRLGRQHEDECYNCCLIHGVYSDDEEYFDDKEYYDDKEYFNDK